MEKNTALDNLNAAHAATIRAEVAREKAVHKARATGASWAEVGAALGTTKQAAQQKYGKGSSAALIAADRLEDRAVIDAADRAALGKIGRKISDADVAGPSVTPSIFLDPIAPATAPAPQPKRPNGPKPDPDESIRNGLTYTNRKPIDWAAARSLATDTPKNCPFCNQRTHYANRTGNWWVYGDCTITHDDLGTKAVQDTYKENQA